MWDRTRSSSGARRWLILLCLALAPMVARAEPLRFFAVGDLPYVRAEVEQLQELLTMATREGSPFIVHVGDIKGGSAPCTDANLSEIAALFRALPVPVLYTPGDNEWTDCHRPGAGGLDPNERLARVREVFFGDESVMRLERLGAVRAAGEDGLQYPENVAFLRDGILFVTLHVVGSDNGYRSRDTWALAEFAARDAANARFLAQATERAVETSADAMVLVFHANPGFERKRPTRGYAGFHASLLTLMKTYPGPVLAIHGDTHRVKHDRPLIDPATGQPFERFTRTEVPGSPIVGGLWIEIDPAAAEPFEVGEYYPIARDRLMP